MDPRVELPSVDGEGEAMNLAYLGVARLWGAGSRRKRAAAKRVVWDEALEAARLIDNGAIEGIDKLRDATLCLTKLFPMD
jgi:hypothetical protein